MWQASTSKCIHVYIFQIVSPSIYSIITDFCNCIELRVCKCWDPICSLFLVFILSQMKSLLLYSISADTKMLVFFLSPAPGETSCSRSVSLLMIVKSVQFWHNSWLHELMSFFFSSFFCCCCCQKTAISAAAKFGINELSWRNSPPHFDQLTCLWLIIHTHEHH